MKFLLTSLVLLSTSLAFAVPVDGKIVYKLPSGELVEREVTLDVPERGQGEVVLSGTDFEWRTKSFKTLTIAGKTTFVAAFKTEFQNKKSTIAFSGTYLKGTNKLMYYGDVYKKNGHSMFDGSVLGFNYIGAFKFAYDR